MIRVAITWRPVGDQAHRMVGLFKSTTEAALFALDRLGERQGSVSAKVAAP